VRVGVGVRVGVRVRVRVGVSRRALRRRHLAPAIDVLYPRDKALLVHLS